MFGFFNTKATDKVIKKYIDTGKVSDEVIRKISLAIMSNQILSPNEMVIFFGETDRVNQMIAELSSYKKENC